MKWSAGVKAAHSAEAVMNLTMVWSFTPTTSAPTLAVTPLKMNTELLRAAACRVSLSGAPLQNKTQTHTYCNPASRGREWFITLTLNVAGKTLSHDDDWSLHMIHTSTITHYSSGCANKHMETSWGLQQRRNQTLFHQTIVKAAVQSCLIHSNDFHCEDVVDKFNSIKMNVLRNKIELRPIKQLIGYSVICVSNNS